MTFRIKLLPEGQDVFTGVLPTIDRRFKGGIRAALFQVGFNLVKTGKDGMQREVKTGVLVKRRDKRSRRRSSSGQFPGIDTGQTIRAVDMEIKGTNQVIFGIRDRGNGPKDLPTFLENGTSKMAPRPTLALSHAAREKDTYNWLRRIPHERLVKK